jgi:hypothetical protein
MRYKYLVFLVGLSLLDGPVADPAPPPTRPAKAPERPAPANRPTTPDDRWNELTGGVAVWRRADLSDPLQQFAFDLVAERVQSVNGEITREQFLAISRPAAVRPKPDDRRPSQPVAVALSQPPAPDESGPVPGAQAEFRRRDRNGDGLLDYDEMDEALRAERDRWDVNKDGFIDFAEFKAYLRARRQKERQAAPPPRVAAGGKAPRPQGDGAAPDLPPKLPDWFRKYDTDGDGQISFSEWRAAGQLTARFRELDANDDGFLTPDEVLAPIEAAEAKEVKGEPEPDPGSLTSYQNQIGKLLAFRVTGAAGGGVWGAGPYTADSRLAVAAVHAGVLEVGKTGTVKVRIVAPPESFAGTTAHGVTTQPFGAFPGAYQIVK